MRDNERQEAFQRSMNAPRDTESSSRRLNSWKEIADFLDRDVRSVQRWEHERGLPVHRIPGQKGGAVFAYEVELETWLRSGKAAELSNAASDAEAGGTDASSDAVPDAKSGKAKTNTSRAGSTARKLAIATILLIATAA